MDGILLPHGEFFQACCTGRVELAMFWSADSFLGRVLALALAHLPEGPDLLAICPGCQGALRSPQRPAGSEGSAWSTSGFVPLQARGQQAAWWIEPASTCMSPGLVCWWSESFPQVQRLALVPPAV